MKFNFDKFLKKDASAESKNNHQRQVKKKEEDDLRRRWLLQFRERWQNRIRYTERQK